MTITLCLVLNIIVFIILLYIIYYIHTHINVSDFRLYLRVIELRQLSATWREKLCKFCFYRLLLGSTSKKPA